MKKFIKPIFSMVLCFAFLFSSFTITDTSAATTTMFYSASVQSISKKKVKKNTYKFTMNCKNRMAKADYTGNKKINKYKWKITKDKSVSYTLDKKCKWNKLYLNQSLGSGGDKKSYSKLKDDIATMKKKHRVFGVIIHVKNKKIIKVTEIVTSDKFIWNFNFK